MKIVIFPNLQKKDAYNCTVKVCGILNKLGAELSIDEKYTQEFRSLNYLKFGKFTSLAKEADIAVAIGGDGTILKCAYGMIGSDTRLLGINTGRLGFMASVEKDNLNVLERLFTNEYKISERMMLQAEYTENGNKKIYHALNDVVVSSRYSKIIEFDVSVNGNLTGNYLADGAVFSTPTGSTAYALSAGGPIIEPELECLEMNLVCPHSLFVRPMVYSADSVISLVHHSSSELKTGFSIDGNDHIYLEEGNELIIRKSPHKMKLIDMTGITFYESLNRKLMRSLKGN